MQKNKNNNNTDNNAPIVKFLERKVKWFVFKIFKIWDQKKNFFWLTAITLICSTAVLQSIIL